MTDDLIKGKVIVITGDLVATGKIFIERIREADGIPITADISIIETT